MVIMSWSCRWILTSFLTPIIVQSSLLNLINAQNLDYPSVVYPPLSWLNVLSYNGSLEAAGVKPILLNGNFVCGFHCIHQTPETCFFAISFLNTSFAASTADYSNQIVWSANRNNPVQLEAELKFTQQGNLVLQDAHGALVWSTDTRAARLNLTNQGNLLLCDKTNKVIWQSFDHPTDSLVPGQSLIYGQKLRSSLSASNLSEGLYSFTIDDHGYFMAYMEPDPSQVYYWSEKAYSRTKTGQFYTEFEDIARLCNSTFTLFKIRSDGHLMGYQSTNSSRAWIDILGISECDYPLVCGQYGLCSVSGRCSCPLGGGNSKNTSYFLPKNSKQPNLGCLPLQLIACESSHDQSMLKLEEGYYINAFTLASYINHTADEVTCKQACLRNCSCKAAIFRRFNATFLDCTLASQVFSIGSNYNYYYYYKNYEDSYDWFISSTFIKVQNSSSTQTTLEKNPSSVSVMMSPKKRRVVIMGSTLGSIFGLLLLCSIIYVLVKKYSKKVEEDYLDHIISGLPTSFSYEELKVITQNFNIKLGEGGFGSVFQGTLPDGTQVAVKRLDGFGPINRSFMTEVETIGSIHHFNLVSLVGFCAEKFRRLLIYEYMCNGSLDRWIFNKNKEHAYLSWESRKKIILDIAKGLAYLHEECKQKIIHLDIKPQNILLDENFNAKVSDFGLSKLIGRNQSQVVTTMRGTPGYMAPEWLSSVITEKADVYSYGIVVLEILCGRPNLDRSQEEDMHLVNLLKRKAEEGQLEDLVDKHGDEMQSNAAEVVETMKVAACCLQSEIKRRPSMSTVVKVLESSKNIEDSLSFDFSNLLEPEAVATDSLTLASSLSGPR